MTMEGRLAEGRIEDEWESRRHPPIRLVRTKQRILVAEDDPDMRALVASALRRSGYDVVEARNGMEAIDHIAPTVWTRRDGFEAIVSDVRMPDLTGLDLWVALRSTRFETPVILMTAFGDEELRAECRSLGATAVLDKPFDLDELHAAVQKAMPSA
jgi:two-component system response regulator (stage 0 sporulation protein F)